MIKVDNSIVEYLESAKYFSSAIIPLQVDASKRKYFRIKKGQKSLIAVDSSLEKESLLNFSIMAEWLRKQGYSSPIIYDINLKNGFSVMEDFGDKTFSKLLESKKNNMSSIYQQAIKLLATLSKNKTPNFLKPFSERVFIKELLVFIDWYKYHNKIKNKKEVEEWNIIWNKLYSDATADKYKTVVLRDFHVDNIFLLEKRIGIKKIGLIDFQDALIGHPSYDLVSLTQDVRVKSFDIKEKELLELYLKNYNNNQSNFYVSYLVFGTQRLLKIIGIFKRLEYKYNKKDYLKFLPKTWNLLKKNLEHVIFKDLRRWFNNYGY